MPCRCRGLFFCQDPHVHAPQPWPLLTTPDLAQRPAEIAGGCCRPMPFALRPGGGEGRGPIGARILTTRGQSLQPKENGALAGAPP
jgi:hypothetical protein